MKYVIRLAFLLWIPAFAGMTLSGCAPRNQKLPAISPRLALLRFVAERALRGGRSGSPKRLARFGAGRQGLKAALPLLAIIPLAAVLSGCAQPQIIERAVYIDKPCERASDYASPKWISVRWIAILVDGVSYAATSDIAALLGNLTALKPALNANQTTFIDANANQTNVKDSDQ